ncbi:AMP-binding protein [Anaerobutyricum soehngenii]|nr:AMP-binding protein [Anaerobutyricum soehngenii]
MEVSKLIQNMREQGIGIWTEGGKIRYLKKDGKLDDDIKNILIYNKKEIISYFEEERERFDKFPLTDIQMAYLLGRKNSFEYGDVASHLYLELDYPALDSVKVQKIWNQLIDKHDMLRAIVLEDGTQEVLRDVAEYPIYISTKCEEIRSKWSDKYYNTETWPMFDIGVTEDKEKTTLHLSFDFLIADWASIWTLLIEFETIYYNKGNGDEKCAISFRNYVLNEMGMKNSSRYRRDKEYWKNRLDIIPEAPVLPMRSNAEKSNKFIRMARKLSAEDWEKIKFFSSQNSVTPTATVLSIFALCIERWSVNKKFSLNLTTLIRNNKYTGIYNTIGDFTSVDVLEIDLSEKIIFADFVKNVNKQIFEDLDHSSYSGIEVIRDLRKRRKNPMLLFPIIFTSSIGLIKNDGMVGKVNNNGISQTPQAFLDCQVMDNEEGLFINWDIRNGIFEEGVIQDIFCTFLTYLKKISESVEFWNQQANVELPEKQMDQRKNVNSTFKEIKMDTLQNLFLKSALEMPKKTAVVDECGEHTYEELLWTAYGIADELQKCSCKAGDYVGIKLNKSFFQIASVLGTLLIGAAFVPIDNDQPEIRADKILEIAKIKCLIGEKEETHKYREKYKWIDKDSVI